MTKDYHMEFMFLISSRACNFLRDASILLSKDRIIQLKKNKNIDSEEEE